LEQAQRFFRYVVPGLTLIIELLAYLLISEDICLEQLIKHSNPIGVAVSALLASGGLGFLLGIIYYTIVWREKILKNILTGADFHHFLKIAESKKWLKLCCPNGEQVKVNNLTKRGAWRVVISYWDTRAEASERIKGAIRRMDRLADIMNGLGTTCVASFGALIFFIIYNIFWSKWLFRDDLSLVFGILMLIVHHWNYKGVIKDYENVCGSVLLNEFECEYKDKGCFEAIRLHVFQNDLKQERSKGQPTVPK
jgi:hypothetical protein